ncbi:MAG: hypothetical protein IPG17_12020 [Sandaracinaceae bacterium]|jgi:hypothetical protein|nr:hypothetical protein [Sandaracinaceae bacterium]MBP7684669.1 hypothetical protein [Deltaproteobacteria bacterium]MBK6808327.1 hypothetical protein [Sandaracinaceae bacterium]MBK7151993.1 hypothetical protein [Sandaracinaceae bacterium]MBK7779116.1 hypothetical protein [Sandaracinaceae bacterium]
MNHRQKEGLKALAGGIFLCVLAVFIYWYLWDFEHSADTSRTVHSLVALLYNVGGKPLASAPFALFGLFAIGKGAHHMLTPSKS